MEKKLNKTLGILLALIPFAITACAAGPQGEQGPQGPQGQQGPQGPQGPQGEKGEQGEQGPQGEKGEKGEQGDPGQPGQPGLNGQDGLDGLDGLDGEKGDKGDKGDQGEQGVSIIDATIDEYGHLIITYSNGETQDAGKVEHKVPVMYYMYEKGGLLPIYAETVDRGSVLHTPAENLTSGYTVTQWGAPLHEDGSGDLTPWYFEETHGFNATKVCFDITRIYAMDYEAKQYTVTFDVDGGDALQDYVATYDQEYELPEATKVGSNFLGWYDEDGNLFPSEGTWKELSNVALKAKWEVSKHVITFLNDDGTTVLQDKKFEYGSHPTYDGEADPQKASTVSTVYTFAGWMDADQNQYAKGAELPAVTGEATYTAYYTDAVRKYAINFVDEDGETVLKAQEVEYNTVPVYAGDIPTKEATAEFTYTFAGWKDAQDNEYAVGTDLPVVAGDATYTAYYSHVTNKYAIKFVNFDETELQNTDVAYGEVPAYEGLVPEKAGTTEFNYHFAGWKDVDGNEYPLGTALPNVTAAATYTAYFSEEDLRPYTFSLLEDGESYAVVGYNMELGGENAVVPSTYLGKPVKVIGVAFAGKENLKTVATHADSYVEIIASGAFAGSTSLEIVKLLSENLVEIRDSAFAGCGALKALYIFNSVESVGDAAFAGVLDETLNVYFYGTEEQFAEIAVLGGNNSAWTTCILHCSEVAPEEFSWDEVEPATADAWVNSPDYEYDPGLDGSVVTFWYNGQYASGWADCGLNFDNVPEDANAMQLTIENNTYYPSQFVIDLIAESESRGEAPLAVTAAYAEGHDEIQVFGRRIYLNLNAAEKMVLTVEYETKQEGNQLAGLILFLDSAQQEPSDDEDHNVTFSNFKFANNVVEPLAKIEVSPAKVELVVGESQQLEAAYMDEALEGLIFKSSNEEVATVSEEGLIEALAAGTAEITLSKEGYADAVVSVKVKGEPVPFAFVMPQTADLARVELGDETVYYVFKGAYTGDYEEQEYTLYDGTKEFAEAKEKDLGEGRFEVYFDISSIQLGDAQFYPHLKVNGVPHNGEGKDGNIQAYGVFPDGRGSEVDFNGVTYYISGAWGMPTIMNEDANAPKATVLAAKVEVVENRVLYTLSGSYKGAVTADLLNMDIQNSINNWATIKFVGDNAPVVTLNADEKTFEMSVDVTEVGAANSAYVTHFFVNGASKDLNLGPNAAPSAVVLGTKSYEVKYADAPWGQGAKVTGLIIKEVPQISVDAAELTLAPAETHQIVVTSGEVALEGASFASSAEGVAKVDENGLITAVADGKAQITVSKDGYLSAVIEVKVETKPAVTGLVKGTNASDAVVNVGDEAKDAIKMGTKSLAGDMTIKVNASTRKVSFYAAGWNGKSTTITVTVTGANGDKASFALVSDTGISGNSPFTLAGDEALYLCELQLSNVTAEDEITIKLETTSTSAGRFVVWGVTAA